MKAYRSAPQPLTPRHLAKLLEGFRIKAKQIRQGDDTGKGYLRSDFTDAFRRYLPPSRSETPDTPQGRGAGRTLRVFGELAAERSSLEATARYREAVALATDLGMRPLAAHCHLGLGALSQWIGRPEKARSEIMTANERYRALEVPFWLKRAERRLEALA